MYIATEQAKRTLERTNAHKQAKKICEVRATRLGEEEP